MAPEADQLNSCCRAVSALERLVEDRTTFFKLDAELMTRSAVKTEDQHRTLAGFEGNNTGYFAGAPLSMPLASEHSGGRRKLNARGAGITAKVSATSQLLSARVLGSSYSEAV